MSSGNVPRELHETEVDPDPFRLFRSWLDAAVAALLHEPYAMALATASPDGKPSVRLVLLRGFDPRGFVFFTNHDSHKGRDLAANPWAALAFYWGELDRQVRIEGQVEKVTSEESDTYFRTRPRGSRLSAWVSPQSQVIPSRDFLERGMAELEARYPGEDVPRPPCWGGFRVVPATIEFWQGRPNRLHDRLRFDRQEDGGWRMVRLSP